MMIWAQENLKCSSNIDSILFTPLQERFECDQQRVFKKISKDSKKLVYFKARCFGLRGEFSSCFVK